MKPKDYINKKAQEEALKAFGATQLNNTQEAGTYFVGKINASRTKITDPSTKKEYDLTFTGNPREFELAQRLSNNTAYVDARKNNQMNVDGEVSGTKLVLSINSGQTTHFYVKDIIAGRLYVIPDSWFPSSQIGGALPGQIISLGVSRSTVTHVEGSTGKFSENGKKLFFAYIITKQSEANTLSGFLSDPYEICWIELSNLNYTTFITSDLNISSLEVYTLEADIVSGSQLIRTDDLTYTQLTAAGIPIPPNYALLGSITAGERIYFPTINKKFAFSNDYTVAFIPLVYTSSRSASFTPDSIPPPIYLPASLNVSSFAHVVGMAVIDLKTGTYSYLPEYHWESGAPLYTQTEDSPGVITTTVTLNYISSNKCYATGWNFGVTTFIETNTSGTYVNVPLSALGGEFSLVKASKNQTILNRYFNKLNSFNDSSFSSSTVDRTVLDTGELEYKYTDYSPSIPAVQCFTTLDPDVVFFAAGSRYITKGAFDSETLPTTKRISPADLSLLAPYIKGVSSIKASFLKYEEDDDGNEYSRLGSIVVSYTEESSIINNLSGFSYALKTPEQKKFRTLSLGTKLMEQGLTTFFILDWTI